MRARMIVVAVALAVAPFTGLAQMRPLARPADLVIPPPEERIVPVSTASAVAPGDALAALADPSGALTAGAAPAPEAAAAPPVGSVTGLPLPRFVSLKRGEGNARRGPSLDQRIDWVFVRTGMPLRLTAEYGHWRRVEDREGLGGWVHYSLLSGARTVIVDQDLLPLRPREDDRAPEVARLQTGVIAGVETCTLDWCRVSAGGYGGWAPKTALWGVAADEVLD